MQFNPHELKEKLLKALDQDQNVVDMATVLDVFSKLERFPITRETLEQTRIGRTVNDFRKKTTDKNLAKRAKNLVKKWQSLISPSNNNSNVNGEGLVTKMGTGAGPPVPSIPGHMLQAGKPVSPASRPSTPYSGGKSNSSSPSLNSARPSTPASSRLSPKSAAYRSTTTLSSTCIPSSPALLTNTPCNSNTLTETPKSHLSAEDKRQGPDSKSLIVNKRKRTNNDTLTSGIQEKKSITNTNGKSKSKPVVNGVSHDNEPTVNNFMEKASFSVRKNANLSVLAPSTTAVDTSSPLERMASSSVCSSERSDKGVRTPLSSRTPKVKTTAQLIQDLATRKELRIEGSETVAKIAQNRIEKEHEEEVSIVPAGAKPRPRRIQVSSLPNASDSALSKTKSEMLHKFLESSENPSQTDLSNMSHFNGPIDESPPIMQRLHDAASPVESSNVDSGHASLNSVKEEHFNEIPSQTETGPTSQKKDLDSGYSDISYIRQQYPHLKGLSDSEILHRIKEDPFSLIPNDSLPNPLNIDSEDPIVDYCDTASPVTSSVLSKLHEQSWGGVNGCFDKNHEWHDWTQSISLNTYNNDLLHVLPYVDLE